ncbi:HPr kinase/phosphorylase [Clostridium sp. D2Q-14]|uniref:HPr(Ser) kinase/phosphatase n=1 Tax=Anaeromonas gelatinilytica TaxID=2683194 RepID=UPI00193C72A1|nr:HPr(Ser) kinase/phosphatase [Anaeromonas gelatinilytica]MBS4534802.1 HPr kinase/phosphorylase [Anaeromonas gelatinilytica]
MESVSIKRIIKDLDVEVIYESKRGDDKIIKSDINRPGLQLAGYEEYFAHERIQIIGKAEWNYLQTLDTEVKYDRLNFFFSYPIPALIVTRNLEITEKTLDLAKKYDRTILRTGLPTTKFVNKLITCLDDMLAPSTTIHGVLVDIYGIGVLIVGKSGVGKSETALELIKRGHRLIADDAVEIKRKDDGILKGMAPELIRHFLEIRGLGILDIKRLYGVGAVRNSKGIDLIIELEYWNEKKEYDRIGLDEEYDDILGIEIPKIVVPVKPGRNLAMIVEVAARNHRQKKMGYNAAVEFNNKLMGEIERK